jgi:hypothetical protein
MKAFTILSYIFFVSFLVGCNEEKKYYESKCTLGEGYVFVETETKLGEGKRGFIFDSIGITFRVKPLNYAKTFSSISQFQIVESTGWAAIYVNDDGGEYQESIGFISKTCATTLYTFLQGKGVLIDKR